MRRPLAVIVAALLLSRQAAAQQTTNVDEPITLTWEAPPSCSSERAVITEVFRLLGGKPARSTKRLKAHAVVAQTSTGWSLELRSEIDGEKGKRQLSADSC